LFFSARFSLCHHARIVTDSPIGDKIDNRFWVECWP
jgi:hypothetical protein